MHTSFPCHSLELNPDQLRPYPSYRHMISVAGLKRIYVCMSSCFCNGKRWGTQKLKKLLLNLKIFARGCSYNLLL